MAAQGTVLEGADTQAAAAGTDTPQAVAVGTVPHLEAGTVLRVVDTVPQLAVGGTVLPVAGGTVLPVVEGTVQREAEGTVLQLVLKAGSTVG